MHRAWESFEPRTSRVHRTAPALFVIFLIFLGVVGGVYGNSTLTTLSTLIAGNNSTPKSPDFVIATSPLSLSIAQGSQGTYVVSLYSLNGFAGSVNITTALSPTLSAVALAVLPNSISLFTGSSSLSITVTIASSALTGTYSVNVTAASHQLSHSIVVSLIVIGPREFSLAASVPSITMSAGSVSNSTITLTGVNGFSGNVSIVAGVSQSKGNDPQAAVTPNTITMTSGMQQTAVLMLSTSNGTKSGTYTVIVIAASGSLSHSVQVSVTVQGKTTPGQSSKS